MFMYMCYACMYVLYVFMYVHLKCIFPKTYTKRGEYNECQAFTIATWCKIFVGCGYGDNSGAAAAAVLSGQASVQQTGNGTAAQRGQWQTLTQNVLKTSGM